MSSQNFFGSYAAIRFATGKKAPGVIWPLIKAFGIILYIAVMAPIAALRMINRITISKAPPPPKPPRPTTVNGRPRRFQDHIDDLQEDMK